MGIRDILNRVEGVRSSGGGWTAKCPAHDDTHNSLSISTGRDGRILLKCHAGCGVEAITDRMGLTMRDLFPDQPADKPKRERSKIVASYTYPNGTQKIRYADKTFGWRRPDGNGGWIWNRQGVSPSLYVAGVLGGAVCVVEGEKDADSLHRLGYDAASGADGAGPGKWKREYTEQLKGSNVVIFEDNNKQGREYAQETAAALYEAGIVSKVLDLRTVWPDVPEKGDISDLIVHFGDERACELIVQLMDATPDWTPAPQPETAGRAVKSAASFGEDDTSFLWPPYLPIGDYTVFMAEGGSGKTVACCGIAAAVSTGKPLPGEVFTSAPKDVLIISAEDSGEVLKKRLQLSGADLNRVFILDRSDSIGLNFSDGYDEFEATVKGCAPSLVIIDPWHAFLGAGVDINRVNALRPVFQKLAHLAKKCQCAMILVSHVNKRG